MTHHDSVHNEWLLFLNHHRSPSPGGKIVALCFSDNPIDIVLAPSDIEVHPIELVLRSLSLLAQFQELMQLAAPPCSPPLPPLTGILAVFVVFIVYSPVGSRPASKN